ncbi:gliding motility-associated C-terminal domain-containing protein [Fulvivirga ligni]|uniref:T9SS type B sorting domain-containing protein n=1 Tax=Fulvivirga ligni TaxID=2904246 RepID=UPI001F20B16B|nr:gliding motility-associated C-terminal domain-containing protein [Fulvivirga ligni]UII21140.1 gliding motility-associated C-terminal domain-containing protein [Fulvivirga ligni]
MALRLRSVLLFLLIFSVYKANGQNCSISFTGNGVFNYSSYCGNNVDNLNLGQPVPMGSGDTLIFDSPSVIYIGNNLNLDAYGDAVIIIPEGVTVIVDDNFNLDPAFGQCDNGDPCDFNFVVEGTLRVDNNLNNKLNLLIWSGHGTVEVDDNMVNDRCMTCGDSCPAFPAGDRCNDNGNCGGFCDGQYGNDSPIGCPTVNAGSDINTCSTSPFALSGSVTGDYTSVQWTSSGSGSFNDDTSLNAIYTPSAADISSGLVNITLTAYSDSCVPKSDQLQIQGNQFIVDAGSDQSVCENTQVNLSGSFGGGVSTIVWSSSGDGVFSNVNDPNANYTYGLADISSGNVTLTMTAPADGFCPEVSDDVFIDVRDAPMADGGGDRYVCESSYTFLYPILGGSWSKVSGPGNIVGLFVTSLSSSVPTVLRWTVTEGGCTDSDLITIYRYAEPSNANAGTDQSVCSNSIVLNANTPSVGTGSWSIISGTGGSFSDPADPTATFNGNYDVNYQLRWTISNGSCDVETDNVNIYFIPPPSAANAGGDQSLCSNATTLAANAPTSGTGSWSIINGAGGNILNASNPGSGFTGTPGTTYTLRWTITNGCSNNTDDMTIEFVAPPTIANAGGDQEICPSSVSLSANAPTVGTGSWSIISGSGGGFANATDPNTNFTGTAGNTYTLRWSIENGICTVSTDDVVISIKSEPTIASAGGDQVLCATSANLSGNVATSGTGSWSILSGTGGSFSNNTLSTSAFTGTAGTTYNLRWTITNGCTSTTDDVTIEFVAPPTVSNAGGDQEICPSSVSLSANTPTVGTGSWSIISGSGGSFANASDPNTNFTGTAGNTYTLRWSIENGICAVSTDDVVISIKPEPTIASAGGDQVLCATSANLSGNVATAGTGSWSILSGAGGSFSNNTFSTSAFTGTPGTTYNLRWTISNGCTNTTDDVTIEFVAPPTIANAGGDQEICPSSVSLSANTPTVGTGSWSIISGSGGSFANASDPNTNFTGTAGNTYTLRWSIENGICTVSTDDVVIAIKSEPTIASAGGDQVLCATSANLSGNVATAGTGSWSILSGTGGSFSNNTLSTSTFTGTPGTTYNLRWTITNGCTNTFDDVTIEFVAPPTVSNAGGDQEICPSSVSLSANTPTVGTGSWSIISGSGGSFANASDPNTNFTGTAGNTYTLRWSIENGICAVSTDDVVISIKPQPTIASAGGDQVLCATSANLSGNVATAGTGSWSILSGAGGSFANSGSSTSSFTGTAGTTYNLRWTITNGCTNTTDDVTIEFVAPPTVSNAGGDQEICPSSVSLSANTPTVGTGSWSIISGSGGSFANATDPNTNFTGTAGNTYTLRWSIENGICSVSTDDVVIDVKPELGTASAGTDQSLCSNTVSLSANAPSVGSGTWSVISGSGGNFSNASNPNATFTGTPGNSYLLRWTISNGCSDVNDDVNINLMAAPTPANAGSDEDICPSSVNLSANTPAVGTGTWSIISGSGGNISDIFNPNAMFTGEAGASYVLRWSIENGSCSVSTDDVSIQIKDNPTQALAGQDQTICTNSLNLSANTPSEGLGSWAIISGSGGSFSNASSPTTVFNGNLGVEYILEWKIDNGCSQSSDQVQVKMVNPVSQADAGDDILLCGGTNSINLNAVIPSVGQGKWTVVSGAGNVANNLDAKSSISSLPTGQTVLSWEVSNGCSNSSDEVVIQVDSEVGVEERLFSVCEGDEVTMTAFGGKDYQWFKSGTLLGSGQESLKVTPESDVNYLVKVTGEYCPVEEFTISIDLKAKPELQVSDDTTILYGNEAQLWVNGADSYIWSPAESLDNPTSASPIASPSASTIYKVIGTNTLGCSSEAQVNIIVDESFEVFIPEMFSPNNDTNNDILYVNVIGITEIEFRVYDKTGKEVFRSNNVENGWDGTYLGKNQAADTYVYFLSAVTLNGDVITKKGAVRLVY